MTPGSPRVMVRVCGRLVILLGLVFALTQPSLFRSHSDLQLIVLIDESLSMPPGFTDTAWRQVLELRGAAPANTSLRLIRFAGSSLLESAGGNGALSQVQRIPRSAALDGTATNIAGALRAALHLHSAQQPTIIVLLSDAVATHGDTGSALQAVFEAGVPVYLLAPVAEGAGREFSVRDLQVPTRVEVGDEVPVRALLHSSHGAQVTVSLEVDGQVVRQQELSLSGGKSAPVSFALVPRSAGVRLVTVRVASRSDGSGNLHARRTEAVNVLGPRPLLYLSSTIEGAAAAGELRALGWEVATLRPSELISGQSQLRQFGTIVLDNLAIGDLPEHTWKIITRSVVDEGKGLLVLGGTRSFGAGAYRHSTLEKILPVTAQASQPQEPAAALFVVDRSGSMGRTQTGPSRFALARAAVVASGNMLLPGDYLGVVTFADTAQLALPLAPYADSRARISQALAVSPGGGTRLAPGLRLALDQLRTVSAGRRLLVLVTDGFTPDEDLSGFADTLRELGVTVIALAVGEDANRNTLARLTEFNDGRVLSVDRIATLPRLMPDAIVKLRAPALGEATRTVEVEAPPFELASLSWPGLSAYMVSKARSSADVYLQSSRGDPILATGLSGTGKVAVLPGGLGPWARDWRQWPGYDAFLGGMVRWLEGQEVEGLSLSVDNGPNELRYTVDVVAEGGWASAAQPGLLIIDPSGEQTELSLDLTAPGRYQSTLPATQDGLYEATLHLGESTVRHAVYRSATREFQGTTLAMDAPRTWVERGWMKPWRGAGAFVEVWPRETSGLPQLLLVAALVSYLLLLVYERGLTAPLGAWLRSRFAS